MIIYEKANDSEVKSCLTVKKRIVFPGATYHITQRAPGKELIFLEDNDYLCFLGILKEAAQDYSLQVFCFALLPNHLHLLLQITEKNLSSAMKHILEKYAIYFNKKYMRKGHVFCGRFRASLCNDDVYLIVASAYVHLNPLRAGLCENYRDYKWTSVNLYLNPSKSSFIKQGLILDLLDKDLQKARDIYVRILSNSILLKGGPFGERKTIYNILKFAVRTIKDIAGVNGAEGLDSVINHSLKNRDIKEQEGKKYAIEQLLANGYEIKDIAAKLNISRATYYRILAK